MLFVSQLETLPGKLQDALSLAKNISPPQGITVKYCLGLFGKPDILLVFEAPTEADAARFITKFGDTVITKTSLAFPIEQI
jgi:uncharacterized protein with GYD domain